MRNVVALWPRGNRKTSFAAALGLLHTIGPERVNGGQIIAAAADRKQARIAYDEAVGIVREDKEIAAKMRFLDYRNRLVHPKSSSIFEAISCDAGTQHGRTPTMAIADELHAWKKRDLWDVVRTGLVKVPGSLLYVITTAGRGQENIAHDIIDYARKVARGDIPDPATLPILLETPKDADWRDETIWHRVNPGLPVFPDIEGLRQLAREAEQRPGDRDAFRQLHLNVWLDHSTDPFIDMGVYDEGKEPFDLKAVRDLPCWLAVDLSSTTDLTVIVACWRGDDATYYIRAWFFCPKDNLKGRADRDKVPYQRWADEGFIEPTPGNVVDYRRVEDKIGELCEEFNVREVAADPHMARNLLMNLNDDGIPAHEFRQGWMSISPAINELERAIIARKFRHGGNPLLRWCFENVAVETDKAGNRSFHKGKSRDRIDGAVAAAMAVKRAFDDAGEGGSIYEDPNVSIEDLVW